ncbi:MAG: tRNA pseudouridine(55) synthase TruB [Chloroflexota bacterium]
MSDGLLIVDKPAALTSHDVVQRIRRLTGIRRVGHAGTLDPLATGVLVICLGRATRLVEYVMGQSKRYEATIRLGQETTTYDAEGEVVAERPVEVTSADLAAALAHFRGSISQTPPMFSALKVEGRPLYQLARRQVIVERTPRPVTVYELILRQWRPPFVQLNLSCSAGFYVRSLAHDLGQALGCGAHLAALRRTAVGSFTVAEAVALDTLTSENWPGYLQSSEAAVSHLPRLILPEDETRRLQQGQKVARQPDQIEGPTASLYDPTGRFIGLVSLYHEFWQPAKILFPV